MDKQFLSIRDKRLLEIPHPLSEYLNEGIAEDQITSLDLGNNLIRILNNIESFPRLRELQLEHNKIHSLFIRGLHSSLRLLNLSFNELRRCSIGISEFPHLTELHLDNNLLTHIEDFESFPKTLRLITSNNNQIHTSSSNILIFPNLKELQLSGNNIGNVEVFQKLFSLEKFNLSSNSIPKIDTLSALSPNLTYLNLSRNYITSISPLSSLVSLKTLLLSENCIASSSEEIFHFLETLSSLEKLDLRFNPSTCLFYFSKRVEETEKIFRNIEEFEKLFPFSNGLENQQERAYYRDILANNLRKLELLDNILVSEDEREGKSKNKVLSKKFFEEQNSFVEVQEKPEDEFQNYLNSTADELDEEDIAEKSELDKLLSEHGREQKIDEKKIPNNFQSKKLVEQEIKPIVDKSNDSTIEYQSNSFVEIPLSTPIVKDAAMRFEIQIDEPHENSFFEELKSQSERISLIQKDIEAIKIGVKTPKFREEEQRVSQWKLPNPLQVAPQTPILPQVPVNPFTGSPIIREIPITFSPSSFADSNSLPNITDTSSPIQSNVIPSVNPLLALSDNNKEEIIEEVSNEINEKSTPILPSVEIDSTEKKGHAFWVNVGETDEEIKKKEQIRLKKLEKLNERKTNIQFKWKNKNKMQKEIQSQSEKKKEEEMKVEEKHVVQKQITPPPPKPQVTQKPHQIQTIPKTEVVNHRKLAEEQIKNQPLMRNIEPDKTNFSKNNRKTNQRTELTENFIRNPRKKENTLSKSAERSQAPKISVQRGSESLGPARNKTNKPKVVKAPSPDSDEEFGVRKGSKLSPANLEKKLRDFGLKTIESSEVLEGIEEDREHKSRNSISSTFSQNKEIELEEKINKKLFSDILLLKILLCKWSRIPPSTTMLPPLENETIVKDLITEHPEFTACSNLLKLENPRFEVRHVVKLYNHGFHQNLNALDDYINQDGSNIHLLFHCASPIILSRVSREGFGMYKTAGELLVATSAIASEAYAKEFLPWKETEDERKNSRVHRVLLTLAKISHTLSWSEAEGLQNLSPNDSVIFPISPSFESQGMKDFVYIFTSPDRLVPCYLLEYVEK